MIFQATFATLILFALDGSSVSRPTSLENKNIHLWLKSRVNQRVCVANKINGTMGYISLKYRLPKGEDLGIYTSHVRTDISQRKSIELGYRVGMKVIVCGKLLNEPNIGSFFDPDPRKRNYLLRHAMIVVDPGRAKRSEMATLGR